MIQSRPSLVDFLNFNKIGEKTLLINPDHVQYMNDEYERRLTAFRLERKLRKARAERSQAMLYLVQQAICRAKGWVALAWPQVRWTPPALGKQDGATALHKSS